MSKWMILLLVLCIAFVFVQALTLQATPLTVLAGLGAIALLVALLVNHKKNS